MTDIIKVYKGDKLFDLEFTLQDANGVAVDLTSASALVFKFQKQGVATATTGTMSVISAAAGTCKYTVADGDFATAGDYYAEIQVTFGSGKIITFGNIVVRCLSDLPR